MYRTSQSNLCESRLRFDRNPYPARGSARAIGTEPYREAGFGMLEVLISMVIVLVGVLGLAGLIIRSNQSELESYQRVQATLLLQDMVDRMNANRKVASCYSNGGSGISMTGVSPYTPAACATGTATEQDNYGEDLKAWNDLIAGSAESKNAGVTKLGAMIGAQGCIDQIDAANNIYMVSVAWQGLAATAAPKIKSTSACYSTDAKRRVISATVRMAALS